MYYKKALEDEEASRQKEKSPFPTGKDIASKKNRNNPDCAISRNILNLLTILISFSTL